MIYGPNPGDDARNVDRIALDDAPSRELVEVWQTLVGISFLAAQIPLESVDALLAELDRTDALMPILDPTAYRGIMGNVQDYRGVFKAFRAFRAEIGKHDPSA